MNGVLMKITPYERDTERPLCEDESRDQTDTSISQRVPKNCQNKTKKQPEARKET